MKRLLELLNELEGEGLYTRYAIYEEAAARFYLEGQLATSGLLDVLLPLSVIGTRKSRILLGQAPV